MLIFLREEVRPRGFIRDSGAHRKDTGVCGITLRVTQSPYHPYASALPSGGFGVRKWGKDECFSNDTFGYSANL